MRVCVISSLVVVGRLAVSVPSSSAVEVFPATSRVLLTVYKIYNIYLHLLVFLYTAARMCIISYCAHFLYRTNGEKFRF